MTDEQREQLADLLRVWLQSASRPLLYMGPYMGPHDMINNIRLQSLRSEAVQGATALLKQLLVELGSPAQ